MRALRNLFALVVIVAVLGGGALVAFRIARQKPSNPEEIKPNLMAVSSAGSYLYAARVGTARGARSTPAPTRPAIRSTSRWRPCTPGAATSPTSSSRTPTATTRRPRAALTGAHVHLGQADVPFAEGRAPWDNLLLAGDDQGDGQPRRSTSATR